MFLNVNMERDLGVIEKVRVSVESSTVRRLALAKFTIDLKLGEREV